MRLSDIVLKEFKDKGIEVTIYDNLAGNGVKCVVDTYKHDKQIRNEVIEKIEQEMYNQAFLQDRDKDGLQKWDSGNWIRYKLFENVIGYIKEHNNE